MGKRPPDDGNRTRSGARLALAGVARRFVGTGAVVAPIDLVVEPGELVLLLGPSGCGKSTLLRLLAGLDVPDEGTITRELEGAPSYVFQDPTLLPWRTASENVALPLELQGVGRREALERAAQALADVGLADAGGRRPAELSGGMRMRVSVARALVTRPSLLLLDEPFAALDEQSRHKLQDDLHALWRDRGMTVVFVTHSVAEAAYLATRTLVFSPRPARVVLDRRSELGAERGLAMRTDPRYVREMQVIYDAFH